MSLVEVLKFGSSVLRSPHDLPVAVDEIYRRWRCGCRVLAVVSAFEGVTNQLLAEASEQFTSCCPEAGAAYVATGEQKTAALLVGTLRRFGVPSRLVDPREIGLVAEGPLLESIPVSVDVPALERLWRDFPILVLPGFFGIDAMGRVALFGRGGSDLSALFLAAELGAGCRLLKDVPGVFNTDPAADATAHRYSALSWASALEVAGPLIQPKALRFANSRELSFEVGRPNEEAGTLLGHANDRWASSLPPREPLNIVLLGLGVVGRGVYDMLKRLPERYRVCHVVVREVRTYASIEDLTQDAGVVLDDSIDLIIECFGGTGLPSPLMETALASGKFVISANKAAVAARWPALSSYVRGDKRRLWYSAAVGGAVPMIEALNELTGPVREIRGIVNGTCGVVMDALAQGKSHEEAIAIAQAGGFAEADPARDLSGRDSADKLALLIEAAFGVWLPPGDIPTRGIATMASHSADQKLIARATRTERGIVACVAPEAAPAGSFLSLARGPENRLEIETAAGEVIRLRGQGAGRWPTALSVMGDLHEVSRLIDATAR